MRTFVLGGCGRRTPDKSNKVVEAMCSADGEAGGEMKLEHTPRQDGVNIYTKRNENVEVFSCSGLIMAEDCVV